MTFVVNEAPENAKLTVTDSQGVAHALVFGSPLSLPNQAAFISVVA